MKILVTGSTGFLGSRLVAHLKNQGHEVVSARRKYEFTSSDKFDAVIHLAGAGIADKRWTTSRKREILESRESGTRNLCEQLAKLEHKPQVLLSMSAVGYYGNCGDEILTEESPSGIGFLAEVVRRWEAAAEIASSAGIRVATMRAGVVLDSRGGALKKMLLPFKLGLGGRLGNGRQYMPWITLEDFLRAVLFLLSSPKISGAVNVCSPQSATNVGFTHALAKALHRPAFLPTPLPVLNLLYGRELVAETLLSSQRAHPAKLLQFGFTFRHPDLESALRAALER